MLTLITGTPGAGKTLCLISMLMNRADLKCRPLFLDGIPDVKQDVIPHLEVPEGETMQTWPKWAPEGAILVIDECQRVFRCRSAGSKVPDYVAELETHRHRGLDFFLITQGPRLIDSNVRALIGQHMHISMTKLGIRRMATWNRCANPDSKSDIAEALVSIYKLDKRAYGVYKSAEVHTKIKVGRSKALIIAPIALVLCMLSIGYSIYWVVGWFGSMGKKPNQGQAQAATMHTSNNVAKVPALQVPTNTAAAATTSASAPAVSTMPATVNEDNFTPEVVACVASSGKCRCYSDQATLIRTVSYKQCMTYVSDGIYRRNKSQSHVTIANQTTQTKPVPSAVSASQPVVASK